MDQPAWLDEAWREYGQREADGAANNPRVVAFYRDAGQPGVKHDSVAWCAAFLGACLERRGTPGTRSLMARSYAAWGDKLAEPRTGAIAVLSRTEDPALGHVGFVVGASGDDLFLLGGNQNDEVSVMRFPKSRLLSLRWPAAPSAQPPAKASTPAPATDIFDRALDHVLAMEGGFTDDPNDPGGPTNKGITIGVYAAWKNETWNASSQSRLLSALKQLGTEELRAIYRKRYWDVAGCAALPPALALMQFDTGVNHGPVTAIRILQEVLGVAVDGELGPLTQAAVAAKPLTRILDDYADNRRARYRAMPHFWRFGRGWLSRVDSTLKLARSLVQANATSTREGDTHMTDETSDTGASKWWGSSLTIWGAVTTGLAAFVPVIGPLLGFDLSSDVVQTLGHQAVAAGQALVAVIGTVMTILGRSRATQPIERKAFNVRI